MTDTNTFLPAFGNRPDHIVGRDDVIEDFLDGLSQPIGHQKRATILIGQRGTGKTALLLEFADLASPRDYVVARVTANRLMLDEIIQILQIEGARFVGAKPPSIKGFSAGALGFSIGLTFTEEAERNYGFRVKLTMLCDELARHGKKVLILIDEVQPNSGEVRDLASTYQHLVGEKRDVAIVMAGLPDSISSVLNDDILTFLNRAHKIPLNPLPLGEISLYYARAFAQSGKAIDSEALEAAVKATRGYPYLLQLIGYFVLGYSKGSDTISMPVVERAIVSSKQQMIDSIFNTVLDPLSVKDTEFLRAMARDNGASEISTIAQRMKVSQPYAQRYRRRLIEAGVIAASGRGKLDFVIPYLGEYLRGEF